MTTDTQSLVGKIIAYEQGMMESSDEVIALFQELVDNGMAWNLQGSYGRMANYLLDVGLINPPTDAPTYEDCRAAGTHGQYLSEYDDDDRPICGLCGGLVG